MNDKVKPRIKRVSQRKEIEDSFVQVCVEYALRVDMGIGFCLKGVQS